MQDLERHSPSPKRVRSGMVPVASQAGQDVMCVLLRGLVEIGCVVCRIQRSQVKAACWQATTWPVFGQTARYAMQCQGGLGYLN